MAYTPPSGTKDVSWVGAADYRAPYSVVPGAWYEVSPTIYAVGFDSSVLPALPLVTKQQFALPAGVAPLGVGTAQVTDDTQYIVPYAVIDGTWVGADGYTPAAELLSASWEVFAAGDPQSVFPTSFNLSVFGTPLIYKQQFVGIEGWFSEVWGFTSTFRDGEYVPADGLLNGIWPDTPYVAPEGEANGGWNRAAGKLSPFGFARAAYGDAFVELKTKYIGPPGGEPGEVPAPTLINASFGAAPAGIAPPPDTGANGERQIPSPFIADRIRYAAPAGVYPPFPSVSSGAVVAYDIQFVDIAGRGPSTWVAGTPRIEFAQREVSVPFLISNVFGTALVARIQVAEPSGWDSSFLSENNELDINLQRILHHSGEADQAGYGVATVRNQFEILRPLGWASTTLNFPILHNLDQYLLVQPYMDTTGDPTQWPPYSPLVENKDRVLGPGPWQSSRFSVIGNVVENTAVPITPAGPEFTLWGAGTFIAHRDRYLLVEGWDSYYSTRFGVIANDAQVAAPAGIQAGAVGVPSQVLNLNRTVQQVLGYVGGDLGTAFVAPRVRYLAPNVFYDVPASFPEVRHNPYPVLPVGIPPKQIGGHDVFEFFATISPFAANVHATPWVGQPDVQNRNKTIGVYPSLQTLHGSTKIFNFNTNLTVSAGNQNVFGATFIGLRTRTLTVAAVSAPSVSVIHVVRNELPDPPSRQLVFTPSLFIGTEALPGIVPAPGTRLATIYPTGIAAGDLDAPVLTRNTIEVPRGFFFESFGIATLATTQFIYPKTLPWPNSGGALNPIGSSDENSAKPRVTPHTIYAPGGDQATYQAHINHLVGGRHIIDGYMEGGGWSAGNGWPWFGLPGVTNKNRSIGPVPNHALGTLNPATRYGAPAFTLRLQVVQAFGIRSERMGYVVFLNVPQYVDLSAPSNPQGIAPSTAWGSAVLSRPPELHRTLSMAGFVATGLSDTHKVELFNRSISVSGIPHRGNPQQFLTTPWGTALVGYPRVYWIAMGSQTLWGNTIIEYKNREVLPEGFNSCSLEDGNFEDFRQRMTVVRRNPLANMPSVPSTLVFGACTVTRRDRLVYTRGVDSYNGGASTVTATADIAPLGWESLLVGDIDRWEAGTVKAYGDELSSMGTPRMGHTLALLGLDSEGLPTPRVSPLLTPLGIPAIGFDGPSVSNPDGCTNRVVSPLPALSTQNVPEPTIA